MENSKNNQHGATLDDIYEVVTFVKDNAVTKEEFDGLKGEVSGLKGEVSGLKGEVSGLKGEVSGLKGEVSEMNKRLTRVETTMVTKDYLDEKIADLRGDLVVMMRKEDTKLKTLVGVLHEKKVIDSGDVKKIYSLEPFAQ
jgi:predicted  nucleic acid-binding Zn-ribbon protein